MWPLCSGVYGDVMRVKILFNKKENALVQMSDSTQAQLGNGSPLPPVVRRGGGSPSQGLILSWNAPNTKAALVFESFVRRWTAESRLLLSHESPERPAAVREAPPDHAVQTQQRPDAPRRPRGPGSDQRLQQLPLTPLQEARLQKLLQHLPTVRHPAPLQHPVSPDPPTLWGGGTRPVKSSCPVGLCFSPSVGEDDLTRLFSTFGAIVKGFKFFQ